MTSSLPMIWPILPIPALASPALMPVRSSCWLLSTESVYLTLPSVPWLFMLSDLVTLTADALILAMAYYWSSFLIGPPEDCLTVLVASVLEFLREVDSTVTSS